MRASWPAKKARRCERNGSANFVDPTGSTAEFVDKAFGPGTLEYADGAGGMTSQIPGIGGSDTAVLHITC
ncbi:MAG: hypothetical protein GY711_23085 [bacterium]|nr:hypothetical protein [bacterium]